MIRTLVFDFDGLMVDTESPARDSWVDIYREYGQEFPFRQWSAVLGGSGREFDPVAYLAERAGLIAVAVPNPLTGQLPLDHADLRLASLADVPLESLLGTIVGQARGAASHAP